MLIRDHKSVPPYLSLVCSCRAGLLAVPSAMESTRQLEDEDEWAVWRVFEDNIRVLVRLLSRYSVPGNKAKVSESDDSLCKIW